MCCVRTHTKERRRSPEYASYVSSTAMIHFVLGLKNSISCGTIIADIHKITIFVFPQLFLNSHIKNLDCTPASGEHVIFC
jgi:hypothetical protein